MCVVYRLSFNIPETWWALSLRNMWEQLTPVYIFIAISLKRKKQNGRIYMFWTRSGGQYRKLRPPKEESLLFSNTSNTSKWSPQSHRYLWLNCWSYWGTKVADWEKPICLSIFRNTASIQHTSKWRILASHLYLFFISNSTFLEALTLSIN